MNKVPPSSPTLKRDDNSTTPATGNNTPDPPISHPSPTTSRPPLQRFVTNDVAYHPSAGSEDETTDTQMSEDDGVLGQQDMENTETEGLVATAQNKASPDEVEIDRLRKLQLKVLQQQQRARTRSRQNVSTVNSPGARRVSPIKEEPITAVAVMSPTLEEAFQSPAPLLTGFTTSTESTESARTIRGSVPPTPIDHRNLRTPSYPFPTVPSSPRWSSAFHMPFTSLSPTVSAYHANEYVPPKDRLASETSTPGVSTASFAPGGTSHPSSGNEDSRFPSPSLYDLVLRLGVEPGLAAWWTAVTSIMRDHYGASRATLAVPADASDIENVPWGQKTSFTAMPDDDSSHIATYEETKAQPNWKESTGNLERLQNPEPLDLPPTPSLPERRPKLFTHHSFAGHERQKPGQTTDGTTPLLPVRPKPPLRAVSHAPQATPIREHPLRQVFQASFDGLTNPPRSTIPSRGPSFSDLEFSSIGGDPSPPIKVFNILRALNHEPDALIDSTGINRVLERGRLVTLTRDYSISLPAAGKDLPRKGSTEPPKPSVTKSTTVVQENAKSATARGHDVLGAGNSKLQPRYEEYEQFPSSPWAQSPAPSPATQNDADANPFFTTGYVDEDTFNPSRSPQDYTQFSSVEAIGVDRASTVIHIPLIHPLLSQSMHTMDTSTSFHASSMSQKQDYQSIPNTPQAEPFTRKAPIAILSMLSPIAPYPSNLTNSLKHLAPHLATSFSNAWQFTNAQAQVASIRQRRMFSGTSGGAALSSDQESLDDLLHLDLEDVTTSLAGSINSPSDYSGRSRHSPGGSTSGTPGWDTSSVGFSGRHSITSTPSHLAGSEAVEGYFDAKKKTSRASAQTAASNQEQLSQKPDKRIKKRVSVSPVVERTEEQAITPRNDKVLNEESSNTRRSHLPSTPGRTHSFLHSYGADFSSSFQSLPATAMSAGRPMPTSEYARRDSISETLDMPPPSESLLRTIIDSLPVQIFTAAPNTGAITWVNSKFLIYRGQDSRQVLQSPWNSIHPNDRDSYIKEWNACLRTGQQLQKKVRMQRFDQCYRWFYVRVAPLKNKRQQIVHWIGTNMDFHEQHLAEMNSARQQEIAASEAKYKALANSSPQIVFVVSNRRGLTFCNSQWITFSGQTEAQAHGNGFLEHVHSDDVIKCKLPGLSEDGVTNVPTTLPTEDTSHDSNQSDDSSETIMSPGVPSPERLDLPQAKLSELASTGILRVAKDADGRASYSTEVRLRNRNGDFRWHLVRILLEKSLAEDSEEETWYGTATDINDHKLLEQTLKETMDAKSKFLSNMSHEIRTPLNGISGMVNFLLDSILNAEQLEHVNIIKASTDSLLNLINDILDLSKVEAGMIKLSMDWLHLPSLIEEVNDLNMGLAIQKGLELNYLVEEGVPSMVKGDKFRIRQVLLNVVGNAIKFTSKGEVFVRCRLQPPERLGFVKESEIMIRFEVVDTGAGFTEAEAKYLFKRFSQIDASSTRQHGGTGLGLAISMQFVELHGGRMDAQSIPTKGSTFFFTIKFGLPTADDFPKPQVSTPATPASEPPSAVPPLLSQTPLPSPLQKFIQSQTPTSPHTKRMSSISSERNEPIKSPAPSLSASERSRDSPLLSSGSSDHSFTSAPLTGRSSLRSESSSASSFLQEVGFPSDTDIRLALPSKRSDNQKDTPAENSSTPLNSDQTKRSASPPHSLSPLGSALQPPMFSILVICPLVHSREATIRHIKNTLPQSIPHQVTGQSSIIDAQRMIGSDDPMLFTHIVLVLHDNTEVHAIMDQIYGSTTFNNTSIVVVSDPSQKKELVKEVPGYDYEQLNADRRLQFIYRPLKPSKFAVIFDPQKEREMSTDRNQDSAQQVVVSQKLVFDELKRRVGGRGLKVLLVEDNKINQTVILKFLARIDIETETVLDGVQCTETVFSKPPGYFSIILCDLHMPNKDGYQACIEIRRWEKEHNYRRHPIIALSANVLGDVYEKCVKAGFNSYVTKPVEFKQLSLVMTEFLDPSDPSQTPKLMKRK